MFLVPLLGFEQPSTLAFLVLLVLLPLGVAALFAFIGIAPHWRRSLEVSTSSTEVARKDV
jgi:hypothetical protein